MPESRVKGDLFLEVLDAVTVRWGRKGLDAIGYDPAGYRQEQWYPLEDMCNLLSSVKSRLGNNNPLSAYQLGFGTVKGDRRWQDIFDDQNPAEIFLSTQRQDGQYMVGVQTAVSLGPKHVRIDFKSPGENPIWLEFYRGRLQGVLELTGRCGVVHLLPPTGEDGTRSYDIKWG